ncbi:uncharacterized protein BX663DRAFT_72429 [Cokeromyces recurvatus]|uniref:uncharacterized protein n=1 Tax=Cokeromyces recurvatus TaxID=90255 RepID=UPI00221F5337|nr:uncharacterized protein BX663DRAFT_72429 [Cokeromyces recurvatus]KAI7902330.1 hypothetical protein BX663DRAFT_72429 [Cokeromyces recurvatus]
MLSSNKLLPWKPTPNQIKQFRLSLKSSLSDFNTFLLTKETTHFTNLSFALTYPGLVHFIYFDKGIMTAPSLVDLNELDKNHELLHQIHGKHNNTRQWKWVWPNESTLKKLCHKMLKLGLSYRDNVLKSRVFKESEDHQYYFLYQKGTQHQELLATYFTIMPIDKLWPMHQKLFHDIRQKFIVWE